jgi:hypothetical protein
LNPLQFKAMFILFTVLLSLLIASPMLQRVLVYPQTASLTEISLLGANRNAANYPYSIVSNRNYTVFIEISNHLGYIVYYQIQIKFRNETQSAPNSLNGSYSSLSSLYNIGAFVANNENWELPATFSFDYSTVGSTKVVFDTITFNEHRFSLVGLYSYWDSAKSVFYGNLVFELWIYDSKTSTFQYHDRFVSLLLNMTG